MMKYMYSPFITLRPLVLASSSPRRQAFLQELGIPFSLALPQEAEPLPLQGESPQTYALRAAEYKARASLASLPKNPSDCCPLILAADTIVVLEGNPPHILGKPETEEQALVMLSQLSGNVHTVITACCLLDGNGVVTSFSDEAKVYFAPWPQTVLKAYVATGEPMDKAGAYGIQGQGAFLVEKIEGSWSTVVGLPMSPVISALLTMGVIAPVCHPHQGETV